MDSCEGDLLALGTLGNSLLTGYLLGCDTMPLLPHFRSEGKESVREDFRSTVYQFCLLDGLL